VAGILVDPVSGVITEWVFEWLAFWWLWVIEWMVSGCVSLTVEMGS